MEGIKLGEALGWRMPRGEMRRLRGWWRESCRYLTEDQSRQKKKQGQSHQAGEHLLVYRRAGKVGGQSRWEHGQLETTNNTLDPCKTLPRGGLCARDVTRSYYNSPSGYRRNKAEARQSQLGRLCNDTGEVISLSPKNAASKKTWPGTSLWYFTGKTPKSISTRL